MWPPVLRRSSDPNTRLRWHTLNGTTFHRRHQTKKHHGRCNFPLLILVLGLALTSAAFGQPPSVQMDWASYEEEVTRLYVDGAKTIRETLEYLNEKHGIIVT